MIKESADLETLVDMTRDNGGDRGGSGRSKCPKSQQQI